MVKNELVSLNVVPPLVPDSAADPISFFNVVHIWLANQPKQRLLSTKNSLGLEMEGDYVGGLVYKLICRSGLEDQLARLIYAHLPGAKIKIQKFNNKQTNNLYVETYQKSDSYEPSQQLIDPLIFMPESLIDKQSVSRSFYQLIIRAHNPHSKIKVTSRVLKNCLKIPLFILKGLVSSRPVTKPSPKLIDNGPSYQTAIRVGVEATSEAKAKSQISLIRAVLTQESGQSALLKPSHNWLTSLLKTKITDSLAESRMSWPATILTSREIASLFHFPSSSYSPNHLNWSLHRQLPLPTSFRGRSQGTVIGQNTYHGQIEAIRLTLNERYRHLLVIGGTGVGKSTFMANLIKQDITGGSGLALIDPHGDLATDIRRAIPTDLKDRLIYFDPSDLDHQIAINLLEIAPGLSPDQKLIEQDLITESVISIFRKIFSSEEIIGHRIEYIIRNSVRTAFMVADCTLATVYDLLTDPNYRRSVTNQINDRRLKNFWDKEIGRAGEFQRVKMTHGITSKLGRFLASITARPLIERPTSSISFDDIINEGKILICDFAKGKLGEDTSALFGMVVIAKLQLAAMHRANLKPEDRKSFFLYIDEAHNFNSTTINQLLSESRKFGLYLTMAQQSIAQESNYRSAYQTLANVGTIICFRTASSYDEKLLKNLFGGHINGHDLVNLPAYNFYGRTLGEASTPPFSGTTITPAIRENLSKILKDQRIG